MIYEHEPYVQVRNNIIYIYRHICIYIHIYTHIYNNACIDIRASA